MQIVNQMAFGSSLLVLSLGDCGIHDVRILFEQ